MTVQEFAALYISRGWRVVPLKPRTKECYEEFKDWQTITFTPDMFDADDNIGIKSQDGLVVVDLDHPDAVSLGDLFLPPTNAIYGRPSKPRSKRLYRCKNVDKTKAIRDWNDEKNVLGKTIVELRASHQDMAPPSVHPDGEILAWHGDVPGDPAEVETKDLLRALQLLSTVVVLTSRYGPPGARHDWMLAVAGGLRQIGLTDLEGATVVEQAATRAGDTKLVDRLTEVRTTFARSDDDPTTGMKKLKELGSENLVKALGAIWGSESSAGISASLLEELNAKHAVIFQQSGDLAILTEDRDIDGRPFLRFSSPETIRMLYPQPVTVGFTARGAPQVRPLGDVWLKSPKRRFYNGIELAPNGKANPQYYNMWRGFAFEPKQGTWLKFRNHIETVICGGNPEICKYVLNWMAQAVQKPGHQANTAIALRGGQGTGKGAFVRGFGALFGVHFVHLDSTRHLTGNFNAHLHNAILVFADEAAWPGDKAGVGALRRMVTEPTLSIERKGMDIMTVPNMIHLLLASNEEWVIPAAIDERRFTVLDVPKTRQNDTEYFRGLEDELSTGGYEAMLYDLMEWNIDIDLRIIPKTQALYEQKSISAGIQRRWWYQILHDGDFWRNELSPGEFRINRDLLYDNYVTSLDRAGQRGLKGLQTELGLFLKKMLPEPYPKSHRPRTAKGWEPREWIFPSLQKCRDKYDLDYGIQQEAKWPAEEVIGNEPHLGDM